MKTKHVLSAALVALSLSLSPIVPQLAAVGSPSIGSARPTVEQLLVPGNSTDHVIPAPAIAGGTTDPETDSVRGGSSST